MNDIKHIERLISDTLNKRIGIFQKYNNIFKMYSIQCTFFKLLYGILKNKMY